MSALHLAKHQIRPDTPLDSLIPDSDISTAWLAVQAMHSLRMPMLESSFSSRRKHCRKTSELLVIWQWRYLG